HPDLLNAEVLAVEQSAHGREDAGDVRPLFGGPDVGRAVVHAVQRRLDVQFAVLPTPVVHAEGGVAGGLDLRHHDARAQRVARPRGQVVTLARLDGQGDEVVDDLARPNVRLDDVARQSLAQAFVDDRAFVGGEDVP